MPQAAPRLKQLRHGPAPLRRSSTAQPQPYLTATHERLPRGEWEKLRRDVLAAAGGVCQCDDCRAGGRVRWANEVDHVVPLWAGGSNDRSNLQAINRFCHAAKTAREASTRANGA